MVKGLFLTNASPFAIVHRASNALCESIYVPVGEISASAFLDKGGFLDFADPPRVLHMCRSKACKLLWEVSRLANMGGEIMCQAHRPCRAEARICFFNMLEVIFCFSEFLL